MALHLLTGPLKPHSEMRTQYLPANDIATAPSGPVRSNISATGCQINVITRGPSDADIAYLAVWGFPLTSIQ